MHACILDDKSHSPHPPPAASCYSELVRLAVLNVMIRDRFGGKDSGK